MFAIAAQIVTERESNGHVWEGSQQVPIFYLSENFGGNGAESIARSILPLPGDDYRGRIVTAVHVTVEHV